MSLLIIEDYIVQAKSKNGRLKADKEVERKLKESGYKHQAYFQEIGDDARQVYITTRELTEKELERSWNMKPWTSWRWGS